MLQSPITTIRGETSEPGLFIRRPVFSPYQFVKIAQQL